MADIRFSDLTAAAVSDVTAATSIVPISIPGGAAPISRKLTFATLVTWLATVGMIATVITAGGFSSTAGKVSLGAAPGTTAAISVDASSYALYAFESKNGTVLGRLYSDASQFLVGTFSAHPTGLITNSNTRWNVLSEAAGFATLSSAQTTARIVGGSTNGLAIRNSVNTRDNLLVTDAGTSLTISNGTTFARIRVNTANGEITQGAHYSSVAGDAWLAAAMDAPVTGQKTGLSYFDGTIQRSAAEVVTVASGFGTLDLMKSGGIVRIGANTGNTANALTIDGTAFGAATASLRLNGLTNGAGASAGTLTNAPSVGNPNFWIPINVAGTVRYVPAW
jgi:hypothetical protein